MDYENLLFKTGDLVQLKSGGPVMTFSYFSNLGWYVCKWFVGKELKSGDFAGADLMIADDPIELKPPVFSSH